MITLLLHVIIYIYTQKSEYTLNLKNACLQLKKMLSRTIFLQFPLHGLLEHLLPVAGIFSLYPPGHLTVNTHTHNIHST